MKKLCLILIVVMLGFSAGCKKEQAADPAPDAAKAATEVKDTAAGGQETIEMDGMKYVGEVKNGLPNGKGELTYPDGKVEKGIFKDGELVEKQ